MKKYYMIFSLIFILGLVLSACQSTQVEEPAVVDEQDDSEEPEVVEEPEDEGEVIELAFWTLLGGNLGDWLQEQVDEFNATHPNIKIVNERQGGYDDLQQKLLASVAAGNPPPLTMVDYKYVPFYAKNGVFIPINEFASDADFEDFIPGLLTDLTYKGEVYAVPYNRSTQGVFYNKDLMAAVGLEEPPTTWEEMEAIGPSVKELGDEYFVTYGKESNAQWMFEPLVYQFGGRVSDENCRFVFNEPGEGGVEVMEFLQRNTYDTEYFLIGANPVGGFYEVSFEWATEGRVLFTRSSTALQGGLAENVNFDWGFTKFPYAEGGTPAVTSGGANIAMTSNTTQEEREAAWTFMHFMSNTENSAWYHMQTGYMPTRYSVLELDEVKEYHVEHPSWLVSVEQLEFVQPTACGVLNAPEWAGVIQSAMDRIILNNEDVQTVLDEAAEELNRTIDSIPTEELIR
ncbi:MAG TPA: hypothetical protein DDX29_11925 [Clostridiales bacterium]|nr:hypothetical protein [Clostridiales bacterium]